MRFWSIQRFSGRFARVSTPLTNQEHQTEPPWYTLLTRYHWYVFALAALGWLFDTFDQQLFTMSRSVTMRELLPLADVLDPKAREAIQTAYGGYATSLFIIGWATGGLIFGTIGDKFGRARTMALTVFLYALFTGLSALSHNWWQFGLFRLLCGLGIGGEFAAGAALVAEVMPPRVRAPALGMLQVLSGVGNMGAALALRLMPLHVGGHPIGWRGLYLVGTLPALLAVFVQARLKEPEKWLAAKRAAKRAGATAQEQFGRFSELFTNPTWRRNALVGLALAISGVIGLWGIGFYSPELFDRAMAGTPPAELNTLKSWALFYQQFSGLCAGIVFSFVAVRLGRRKAFLIAFLLAWASILIVFTSFKRADQIGYMYPLLGFGTFAPFALYAVYFPELFPTRLRTTGTGFCYNVGRYIAATGPLLLGNLAMLMQGHFRLTGFRAAAVAVASCYLIGIVALLWAPETKGKPLTEDQFTPSPLAGDTE